MAELTVAFCNFANAPKEPFSILSFYLHKHNMNLMQHNPGVIKSKGAKQ
jgi:hypothetical protein